MGDIYSASEIWGHGKGITIGDQQQNGVTIGGGESESEEEEDDDLENAATSLDDITSLGQTGTMCRIYLSPDSAWGLVGTYGADDAYYEQSFEHSIFTGSTVLNILAVNRNSIPSDIQWIADDGSISFRISTLDPPDELIEIVGYLIDTNDPWQAMGIIEARPGASWAAVTYRQSLHNSGWSLPILSGQAATVTTPVSFAKARLLFATFMGATGADSVVCTGISLSGSGYLKFTLFNAGNATVTLTDVDIRILFDGQLDGFVSSNSADETVAEYISYRDFSEI